MVILVFENKTETVMVDYLLQDTFVRRGQYFVDFVAVCFIGGKKNRDTPEKAIDFWLVNDKLLSRKDVTKTHQQRRVKFKLFGFPIFRFWAYPMKVVIETRHAR